MSRRSVLSDAQWEMIEPLLPTQKPWSGRPRRDHRQVVEGIIYRYRCGIAWRDLPEDFGPWQTVWKRHRAWAKDGIWDQVLDVLLVRADDEGRLDWSVAERFNDLPRSPARHEPRAHHRGHCETTRISALSRRITRWAALAAGSRPRSTSSSTATACRW